MKFDERLYLAEMGSLLRTAKAKLVSEHADLTVYTVAIWTDPNAAVSAINFDSFENSRAVADRSSLWASKQHGHLLASGRKELAELFKPFEVSRNHNPADFLLCKFLVIKHHSFEHGWETNTRGKCWAELEPVLYKVGSFASEFLADLKLHPEAELGVNSHRDWFDTTWKLIG